MKIEKLSENQIRCVLSKEDLADRNLKIAELAYGSEKAKELFRELMQQASFELGFEAENIPLMIEAIPISSETLILLVTKVEDPEELDTRLSNFSPFKESASEDSTVTASDILPEVKDVDLLKGLLKAFKESSSVPAETPSKEEELTQVPVSEPTEASEQSDTPKALRKVFCFNTLKDVISAATMLCKKYTGESYLFRDADGTYFVYLNGTPGSMLEFVHACNTMYEYGFQFETTYASYTYLDEHMQFVLGPNALTDLYGL